jgi:branched-chain amino acid transport system permease protein
VDLNVIISGLTAGSIYSLIALGFVLIYKATDIVNFAQGEVAMLGAYFAVFFQSEFHLPFYLIFPLAMIAVFIVGILINNLICRPLATAAHITVVIATFATAYLLRSLVRIIWGTNIYTFGSPFPQKTYKFGEVIIASQNLWITIISLVIMFAFYIFFKFSKTGKSMSAAAQNREAAWLVGIDINKVSTLIWGISCGLGAASGIALAPITVVSPHMGAIGIKAFVAAVLGGFNSLVGAVIGGLLLGLIESATSYYISSALKDITAFCLLIGFLVFKPAGLFGSKEIIRA